MSSFWPGSTQRPLDPFHGISNLVSKFLLLWD
jgi:hypothetical protein